MCSFANNAQKKKKKKKGSVQVGSTKEPHNLSPTFEPPCAAQQRRLLERTHGVFRLCNCSSMLSQPAASASVPSGYHGRLIYLSIYLQFVTQQGMCFLHLWSSSCSSMLGHPSPCHFGQRPYWKLRSLKALPRCDAVVSTSEFPKSYCDASIQCRSAQRIVNE